MQLTVIVAIVMAIAGVAFAMQNSVTVTVVFLFWRFDGSLAMIVLLSLALGAVVVALVSMPAALRGQWSSDRQRKEIDRLKVENAELRARTAGLGRPSEAGGSSAATVAEPAVKG